jgi:hypothetical protein
MMLRWQLVARDDVVLLDVEMGVWALLVMLCSSMLRWQLVAFGDIM